MEVKESRKKVYENEKVRRWYLNNRAGSPISADIWRRNIGRYCDVMNTTPDEILLQAQKGQLKDNFQDFIAKMQAEGRRGAYIAIFKQALRSFTKFNGIDYKMDLKIMNEKHNETTEDERVPRREEVSDLILVAGKRAKVSISLMAFSGLRPESLGSYEGNDGMRLGDLEDLDIESLSFRSVPARVNVRSTLSKADFRYFSFLNREGCNNIISYLKERVEAGEKLNAESPLLQMDLRGALVLKGELKERKSGHTFLRTSLVTREIRDAMRKSGLSSRPYVLRAFFATALDRAEYNGLISHPWRQFFMGHKGDIEHVYSTNKRLLPEVVDEMRSAYSKASKFLEPEETVTKDEVLGMRDTIIMMLENSSDTKLSEDQKKELRNLDAAEFQNKISEYFSENIKNESASKEKFMKVTEDQLDEYMANGWKPVYNLPSGNIMVEHP